MKKLLFVFICTLLLPSSLTSSVDRLTSGKEQIQRVIIYTNMALVTRSIRLTLDPGIHKIPFNQLPPNVLEESIRASGKGEQGARITGLELEKIFLSQASDERVQELEEKIRSLEREKTAIEDEKEALKVQKEFIESLKAFSAEKISKDLTEGKVSPAEWSDFLRFLYDELTGESKKRRELDAQKSEIEKDIKALRQDLASIQSPPQRHKRWGTGVVPLQITPLQITPLVHLDVTSPVTIDLELSYIVGGASWKSHYDIHFSPDSKTIDISYLAEITQISGEDWEDVELALSTARPSLGAKAPELDPWFLSFRPLFGKDEESSLRKRKELPGQVQPTATLETMAGRARDLGIDVMTSERDDVGISAQFKVKTRESILSDGTPHMTTVSIESIIPELNYLTVPKRSTYAFLQAKASNTTQLPLLQGPASVFVGPDYMGKSSIDNTAPGEELELSLGVDPMIKVQRELVEKFVEGKGSKSKRTATRYLYKITIENYHEFSVDIEVKDQIPVTRNKEIKVKEVNINPQPREIDQQGIISWGLTLPPGSKEELTIEFQVEHPRDRNVKGIF
jgi:uncharacterized protein (TIGR02231 family)